MHHVRLLLCFLLLSVASRAQTPFIREFWLNENNTPVRVHDALETRSGFIWLATDNGLYRFNGRSFLQLKDALKQPATTVAEIGNDVFVGYKNGAIGIVSGNNIRPWKIAGTRPSAAITALRGTAMMLFAATEGAGVFAIIDGTGTQLSTENGLTDNFIYDLLLTDDGMVAGTDRGINIVRAAGHAIKTTSVTTADGLSDNIVRVLKPVGLTNVAWIGTQEGGVAQYLIREHRIRNFHMAYPWAWGQVNDILPLTAREAWAVTEEGYLLQLQVTADSLNIMPLSCEGVKLTKLIKDKTGNIWCATNKGLLLSTARYAAKLELQQAFRFKDVTAMTFDRYGRLWYTQNDELYRFSPGKEPSPQKVVKTDAAITCLYTDSEDRMWIGTFGKGLFVYNGSTLTSVGNVASLAEGHILSIAAVGNRLWIASLNGVEEAAIASDGRHVTVVKKHNKLSGTGSDYVYQLYADTKGNMWMATDGGGVCMYDGKQYHRWDEASGLVSQVVYCISEDAAGDIWAGTLEQGLFRLHNGAWQQYTQSDGLQNMNVYALQGTASGEMAVVTEDGIDEWYPAGRQFRHFNRRAGLGIDSMLTVPNCIASDPGGNVWVPFEHGFVVLKNTGNFDVRAAVHIDAVSLFFKPLATERHTFDHDENHISIHYSGINFSNPERLHYRYRLDNYDTTWIYTSDEVIPFVQLPPGRYTFRVQASLNRKFTDAAEDHFSFVVVRPFWQRIWFISLVALALLGAGYTYIRLREKNLKNMSRLQKERMVFEYEHLKSQVNPHFLFNSLNTLVSLIEDDTPKAVSYTVHLSDLYRNMLSYKDQDLIWLQEEYEIITNYMYIQKSRFGDALQLHTDIPEHLLKTKRIIPLALQLLVENAIKHNVVSRSRPLTITITADEDYIRVSNPVRPKASKERGAGLGLLNIRKRYALLTGKNTHFGVSENEYIVILPLL